LYTIKKGDDEKMKKMILSIILFLLFLSSVSAIESIGLNCEIIEKPNDIQVSCEEGGFIIIEDEVSKLELIQGPNSLTVADKDNLQNQLNNAVIHRVRGIPDGFPILFEKEGNYTINVNDDYELKIKTYKNVDLSLPVFFLVTIIGIGLMIAGGYFIAIKRNITKGAILIVGGIVALALAIPLLFAM